MSVKHLRSIHWSNQWLVQYTLLFMLMIIWLASTDLKIRLLQSMAQIGFFNFFSYPSRAHDISTFFLWVCVTLSIFFYVMSGVLLFVLWSFFAITLSASFRLCIRLIILLVFFASLWHQLRNAMFKFTLLWEYTSTYSNLVHKELLEWVYTPVMVPTFFLSTLDTIYLYVSCNIQKVYCDVLGTSTLYYQFYNTICAFRQLTSPL